MIENYTMKKLLIFIFIIFILENHGSIEINTNFKTSKTELTVTENDDSSEVLRTSSCNSNVDSLTVNISNVGLGGSWLKIEIRDSIRPKIGLWSDYKQYNNEYSTDIELESYSLKLNKNKYAIGDTIMGHIKCKSKTSKYLRGNVFLEMEGDFFSIVGKTILMRKDGKKLVLDTKDI